MDLWRPILSLDSSGGVEPIMLNLNVEYTLPRSSSQGSLILQLLASGAILDFRPQKLKSEAEIVEIRGVLSQSVRASQAARECPSGGYPDNLPKLGTMPPALTESPQPSRSVTRSVGTLYWMSGSSPREVHQAKLPLHFFAKRLVLHASFMSWKRSLDFFYREEICVCMIYRDSHVLQRLDTRIGEPCRSLKHTSNLERRI